ncbi:hypothetical protein [Stieleria neptunia]|nr:hypothetical protein [Stieleria neptunia]
MTDERIAIVANTRIQSVSVTFPDNTEIMIPPDDFERFRALFRTLAPIKSTENGDKLEAFGTYQLQLFAAGNVADIDVLVDDTDELVFALDGYTYHGGQRDRFVSAAEAIRERLGTE